MVYDWDGHRTRRIQRIRLAVAIATGLIMPIAVSAWSFIT